MKFKFKDCHSLTTGKSFLMTMSQDIKDSMIKNVGFKEEDFEEVDESI